MLPADSMVCLARWPWADAFGLHRGSISDARARESTRAAIGHAGCAVALALVGTLSFSPCASAHQGNQVYPLHEILDGEIDLHDGSLSDWEAALGGPTLVDSDFESLPVVGENAEIGPPDLSVQIYLGWSRTRNTILAGVESLDDDYVNTHPGGDLKRLFRHDGVSVMVDGDHSGGAYDHWVLGECSGQNWPPCDSLLINLQAQSYTAIAGSPDGRLLGYPGIGNGWVTLPPYGDAGGMVVLGPPHKSVIEIMVTPFDTLVADDRSRSQRSDLRAGMIIGVDVSFNDFDELGCADGYQCYTGFYNLSGSRRSWERAEFMVDFVLIGAEERPTAVGRTSWARVKASFR